MQRVALAFSSWCRRRLLPLLVDTQDTGCPTCANVSNHSSHGCNSRCMKTGKPVYGEDHYCEAEEERSVFPYVPHCEVEAYVAQVVYSIELKEKFLSVLPTCNKPTDYGRRPENVMKNRYKNNLPYDETRVKLSIVNGDRFSDYINASYIHGFDGPLQYIASQGPREENKRLEDFWRMICEQEVTAVIMLSNFNEGGQNKVGKYFCHDEDLIVGDYTVRVLNTQEFPKYNISGIQVSNGDISHTVSHYFYKEWPGRRGLRETYTLGSMLRAVLSAHKEGCIVVHCSGGIGRTGTVLMALLLHEMLWKVGGIEPLEVVKKLRESRPRLIENVNQFILGLKLFEEVAFGALHTVHLKDFKQNINLVLKEVPGLHAKANAISNNHTFSSASNSECLILNRTASVLPPDSSRVSLAMLNGHSSSHYINAVFMNGIHESSSVIMTEHPLPATADRFWRLVVENKCHRIIFINTFSGLEAKFPRLLPLENEELIFGSYSLQRQDVVSYESVIHSTVKIVSLQTRKTDLLVTVYEVTSWQFGREIPPSHHALLGVCDLLFLNPQQTFQEGLTLLTCGDGVTGCGLMAGLINVIDQLRRYQEVNSYRTLIRLRAVRREFFASTEQLEFLYRAAHCYAETYG